MRAHVAKARFIVEFYATPVERSLAWAGATGEFLFVLDSEHRLAAVQLPDYDGSLRRNLDGGHVPSLSFSPSVDMAYLSVTGRRSAVESTEGCFIFPETIVNVDYDVHDVVVGLEFDGAQRLLSRLALEGASILE